MVLITTIKKTSGYIRSPRACETAVRLFPYFSCVLFFELYHQMLSVFFVYGKWIGVPLGVLAACALCAAVIGSFYGGIAPRAALLLLYDIHLALTAAMLARAFFGQGAGVPVWVLVCRSAAAPW